MKIVSVISKTLVLATFAIGFQSCDSQNPLVNSANNLTAVKNMLTNSTNEGFSVLGNSGNFLTNALVNAVMPQKLKDINTKLESLGLTNVVEKEKEYIGKAAASSVKVAKPIVTSAIQEMTITDAVSIISGGKGAATQYLKDKTKDKLISAIKPEVSSQLEINGLNPLLEKAEKGKKVADVIGGILGKNKNATTANLSESISQYASEQIVDGLFEVAKDYETKNGGLAGGILNSVLGGGK